MKEVKSGGSLRAPSGVSIAWAVSFSLLAFSMSLAALPPALLRIEPDFGLSKPQLALLSAAMFLPFVVTVLSAGFLSRVIAKGAAVTFGAVLLTLGTSGIALSGSFGVLVAGISVMGAGAGLLQGTGMSLLGELFQGAGRTRVMNYSQVAFALGAIGVPFTMALVLHLGGDWRLVFWMAAAVAIFSAYRLLATRTPEVGKDDSEMHEPWRWPDGFTWLLAAGMFCYVAAEVSFGYWLPIYYQEVLKAAEQTAASSPGFFWTGMILGRIAAGSAGAYVGDITLLRVAAGFGTVFLVIFLFVQTPMAALVVTFLLGLSLACIWPTILSYAGHVHGKGLTRVFPVIIGTGAIGATLGPTLVGGLNTVVGLKAAYMLVPAVFVLVFLIFLAAPRLERLAIGR